MLDNDTVSVVDTNTNALVGNPIRVGNSPKSIAYDPINEWMYVTNFGSNGTVSIIDTNTNMLARSLIRVGVTPQDIAYDPINERMYVTNFGSDMISMIDTNATSIEDRSLHVEGPFSLTYDTANQYMYVSSMTRNQINVIDTKTSTISDDSFNVGFGARAMTYDPINYRLYLLDGNRSSITIIHLISSNLSITSALDGLGHSVDNATTSQSDSITFSFEETGRSPNGVLGYECSLDGSEFVTCTSPYSLQNLEQDENHTFEVRTIDKYELVRHSPIEFVWSVKADPINELNSVCTERSLGGDDGQRYGMNDDDAITFQTDQLRDQRSYPYCQDLPINSNSLVDSREEVIKQERNIDVHLPSGSSSGNLNNSGSRCENEVTYPLAIDEDSHCIEENTNKLAPQKYPQISAQQFEKKNKPMTKNIPLALPY